MSSKPIQTSAIIFPVLSTDFSTTLSSLKRSTLSISNRLRSIASDAEFVSSVADAYNLPLIANERCGSWYIPLERKATSAYFKSTDGHMGEWSFSLRRLNTQVLESIRNADGCVIVDSTRRGKRMPDALSKTVPIWCAVWNRLLFPENQQAHHLHTPPQSVSESERSQIEARLDGFVKQAQDLSLDLSVLRSHLTKPLRPLWVTQDSGLPSEPPSFPDFHPVVLCTSSRRVPGGEASEGGYVQGAGDDSEGWAQGLTAQLFWENKEKLLQTQEGDLPKLIEKLITASRTNGNKSNSILIRPTDWLFVCPLDIVHDNAGDDYDAVIACADSPDAKILEAKKSRYLHLICSTGKLGSRDLRNEFPKIEAFMQTLPTSWRLAISCQTGKDISIGVALATLCLYVDDSGKRYTSPKEDINKNFIRQRLSWIMTSFPAASPSRATLQSVNAFLFSPRSSAPSLTHGTTTSVPVVPEKTSVLDSTPQLSLTATEPTEHLPTQENPDATVEAMAMPLHKVFKSLAATSSSSTYGPWTLIRNLNSSLPSMPSGSFTGTATFTPRKPTAPTFSEEYLYSEEGIFLTDNGLTMNARRKYVWRYRPAPAKQSEEDQCQEGISVWFTGEDGGSANGLFVEMEFDENQKEEKVQESRRMCAEGHHWCEPDDYKAKFEFDAKGFKITYVVKGPRKEYVSSTEYRRAEQFGGF